MDNLAATLSIAGAVAVGAISPGPSFIMIARTSLTASRGHGMSAAWGMGTGAAIFSFAALVGLQSLLAAVPMLYTTLKVAGGIYLLWLGYQIWRGANRPLMMTDLATTRNASHSLKQAYFMGLGTQISNPKTAIVHAGIFATMLPQHVTVALIMVLLVVVFVINVTWYSVVALLLSAQKPRQTYLRSKSLIDRMVGGVMVALGLRLVADSHSP